MSSVELPSFAENLFKPFRYKVLYGGRGSAKSYTVARVLALLGSQKKLKILCGREFQNSINDSVLSLLESQIQEIGLENFFKVTRDSIIGKNGTEFLFKGVRHNITSVKSIPDIDILWLEEADSVSKNSWEILIPTIRKEGSEIWCTYNPHNSDDPTHAKFVNTKAPPENSFILKVNHSLNPWFPEILKKEMEYMYASDPDLALHVWEGECRSNTQAQIFRNKWEFRTFDILKHFEGPFYGADWGFSIDPSVLIEFYIDLQLKQLLIRREAYGLKVELEQLAGLFDRIPTARKKVIRADCSRPETISYMKRKGFNIIAAKKWPGSVEDGVEWLRSFQKIIIHTDCPHMKDEAKNYSYKVDRLTGDILTDIVDKHNHCWDAIRYGAEPLISASNSILEVL